MRAYSAMIFVSIEVGGPKIRTKRLVFKRFRQKFSARVDNEIHVFIRAQFVDKVGVNLLAKVRGRIA